ncbi:MAG: SnoaL-like domain-containing protein [Bosea sp.]|nr:SnoaL-like domain-containing protein [Bosea sp. (in: a-proteobacteria)]
MVRSSRIRLSLISACILVAAPAAADQTPKQIVTAFFDLAFVQRKPEEAALKYISADKYIQHNPNGADGRAAFIAGFAAYVQKTNFRCEIKRVIAEGSLVVVHNHCKVNPADVNDRGSAVVDIFRVDNGLIVEHWDVEQAVPEKSNNRNTMF